MLALVRAALLLVCVLTFTERVNAFFPNFGSSLTSPLTSTPASPAPSSSTTVQVEDDTSAVKSTIRVRKTVQSDIPQIAEILSRAVVGERDAEQKRKTGRAGISTSWRKRMDQMIAKADIESLLRGRLTAMEEGQVHWQRISQLYDSSSKEQGALSEEDRLKLFWSNNERLRRLIAKASTDTGEDNLWKNHNFVLTPQHVNWFNHLQLTAVDVNTGAIAGFCEVAMLSNPAPATAENDDSCRVTTAVIDGSGGGTGPNDNHGDDDSKNRTFSPGITNLVTAQVYRRRGIATRLLQRTERYIQRYWQAERMGLYVEKDNDAAMGLYQSLGYTPRVTCDGGDFLGDMWYMVKDLKQDALPPSSTREAALEVEEAFASSMR